MKTTGIISQFIKLVNERIKKNQATCGGRQLVETDLYCRGRDFPARIKVQPKPRQREAKTGGFLHAVYWQTYMNRTDFFSSICHKYCVPLSLSGIRSSLILMLYALIHMKDNKRDGKPQTRFGGEQ